MDLFIVYVRNIQKSNPGLILPALRIARIGENKRFTGRQFHVDLQDECGDTQFLRFSRHDKWNDENFFTTC
jgi:hypothetical protein